MKFLEDLFVWFDKNINLAYAFIRIFLGAALFIRGFILISDPGAITRLTGADQWFWWYSYIITVHIAGGFLLTIGVFSRLAAFFQIPVLLGAVFVVHFKEGLLSAGQSLELAVLVLVLLVIYFLFGSGDISLDRFIARRRTLKMN